jgi:hypothetical protein
MDVPGWYSAGMWITCGDCLSRSSPGDIGLTLLDAAATGGVTALERPRPSTAELAADR